MGAKLVKPDAFFPSKNFFEQRWANVAMGRRERTKG